jgi:hypothetical protein
LPWISICAVLMEQERQFQQGISGRGADPYSVPHDPPRRQSKHENEELEDAFVMKQRTSF